MAEKLIYSYETIFIIDASLEEDSIKALTEKFTALISKNGTVESVDEWGKRRLAYLINDEADGYYVLYNYEAKPEFPAELSRRLKITEGLLRSMIIAL